MLPPAVASEAPRTVLRHRRQRLPRPLPVPRMAGASGALGGKRRSVSCAAEDDAEARQRIDEAFDSGDAELMRHFRALADQHLEVLAGDLVGARTSAWTDETWIRLAEHGRRDRPPGGTRQSRAAVPAAVRAERRRHGRTHPAGAHAPAEAIRECFDCRGRHSPPDGRRSTKMRTCGQPRPSALDGERGYASGYATSKWAGEVLLREAHARFGIPVSNFRSDMILAHSRWRGQLNVPDMFTRWVYSIVKTGLAPQLVLPDRRRHAPPALRWPAGGLHCSFDRRAWRDASRTGSRRTTS